jgi:hypothetical protein
MNRRYRVWVLFGFLAFLAVYLYRTFSGYYFYDDYSYARFAHQLTEGSFSLQNDTFSHRLGFLLPIAGLYAGTDVMHCVSSFDYSIPPTFQVSSGGMVFLHPFHNFGNVHGVVMQPGKCVR